MLPRNSERCNRLNSLKQAKGEAVTAKAGTCREWADYWPIMHLGYQADIIGGTAEHL